MFKLPSDPYAVIDHQAKVFEKSEDLSSWLIVLLDGLDDPHINPDGHRILAPMHSRRNNLLICNRLTYCVKIASPSGGVETGFNLSKPDRNRIRSPRGVPVTDQRHFKIECLSLHTLRNGSAPLHDIPGLNPMPLA